VLGTQAAARSGAVALCVVLLPVTAAACGASDDRTSDAPGLADRALHDPDARFK